jgi:hypothetical protein
MEREKMKQALGKKVIPRYWWDFHWENGEIVSIDVESDNENYPVVKRFFIDGEFADREVWLAMKFIADLNAGRVDPKSV